MYENLLSEDAAYHWRTIVKSVCETPNWKCSLTGATGKKVRGKSPKALQECLHLHRLTVFPYDAAEKQRRYLQNTIKKPQRVNVRSFMARVEQLNSYLPLLPCVYQSDKATKLTTPMNKAISEPDLANLILRACPDEWEDQYYLTHSVVPQGMSELLHSLEAIEKVMEQKERKAKAASATQQSGRDATKPKGDERKRSASASKMKAGDRIPKKPRTEKYCNLCAEHGGAEKTHNTNKCRKYEKDGTLKASYKSGKPKGNERGGRGRSVHAHALEAANEKNRKLEKRVKKLEKRESKGRKRSSRRYYSDSSDSDSE